MPRGPRILIKADGESAIGRGCVLHGAHFRPEIAAIAYAVAITAEPDWAEITLTEGWRPKIRASRDLHGECRAFDVSLNHIDADEAGRYSVGVKWADRIGEALGPAYQAVAHGKGRNLHIHVEYDP